MRKIVLFGLVVIMIGVGVSTSLNSAKGKNVNGSPRYSAADSQHIKWVEVSLREMQTVRPGMTRSDLLKVFTTEGGLFTPTEQRFVYKKCPYFKVNVKFQLAHPARDKKGGVFSMSPDDKIRSISQPFLEWSIAN